MADKNKTTMEKRGGYTGGPKPVSQLKPPPKVPGAGTKPPTNGKSPSK